VLGFASVNFGENRWERLTINRFGRGRVSVSSPIDVKLKLSKPDFLGELFKIPADEGMSASFCNQAAFKVEEFIKLNSLGSKSGFLHLKA
jgi:hypothetical protein